MGCVVAYEYLTVNETHDGQVVEIVLGPGPGNIVSMGLCEELATELKRLEPSESANRNRKLIILTGEGKHFSFGASVEEHKADVVGAMLPGFHQLIGQIVAHRVPTLAKVSGQCLGGGFEIALACSMIISAGDAKLGVPEIKLGVFPPAASVLLPCKTGDSVVCQMILTGETLTASELQRFGVVNRVAETESLDEIVADFVEKQILPKSASSLQIATEAARTFAREYYDAHIEAAEKLYLDELMATTDAVEGIEAFIAKRKPSWVDG
jgi:cyclohexa-1,5-dienecarbonyl-CoA hydratase